MCACASVEPAEVTLLGLLTAIEGQDLNLSCYATSSNPPVHIRWWLGYKELNTSVVTMEEVRQHSTQLAERWNIYLSKQEDKNNASKRYCTQWVITHAGLFRGNSEKGQVFVYFFVNTRQKALPFIQVYLYGTNKKNS